MSHKEKAAVQQAKVTLHQAIAIGQREVPDGVLIDADPATVEGKVSYAIEIFKGSSLYDVRIDMQDGSVLSVVRRRVHPRDWKSLATAQAAALNLLDAIQVAERFEEGH